MRHLYTLLLLALATAGQSQISFTNQSNLLANPTDFHSGVAVAVADMNADGLDDIIRLDNGSMLSIEYQAAPNQPFANYTHGNVPGEAWAMVIGDVNNDGYNDIFAGGAYDGVKVLSNSGGTAFTAATLPDPPGEGTFVQGSNFADINNDGWLDAFACHDDGESRIWGNDGTGAFALHDELIDMATTPASDNSGNYGSVWTDFDNDRDLDLYIAKCRQGVDDPTDPRRINALFVNDGQSNYTEQAGKYGLKIGWQSWTSDFQDIDNDGDMDCLVTNHDHPLQLLLNDGAGHFTDIAPAAGVAVSGYFIQGILRDFDNDGLVDIITVGNFQTSQLATHLFHNNGDPLGEGTTFTEISLPFGSGSPGSLAVGDLNGDGFQDIYAAYQTSFNNPGNNPDKLWMNSTANGNNYIAFDLQGVESNRMGVGARLEIHGPWGIQIREVRAGESYGIQNSLTQYFGIGTATEVEYAVVHWPSGKMDVLKNPTINQKNDLLEGTGCTLTGFTLGASGPLVICPGQSVTLSAPAGFDYLWSNGSVGQSITVSEPGNISVVAVDILGCAASSEVVAVVLNPDETPAIAAAGELRFCAGGSVELSSSVANGYTWSSGETTQSITVEQSGEYFVTVPGFCGSFSSSAVTVEVQPTTPEPVANNVVLPTPGPATLTATGINPHWYDSPTAPVPLAIGNEFVTPELATTTTFHVSDAQKGFAFETGMPAHLGTPFNGNTFNGDVIFNAMLPLTLRQVTVTTDSAGVRIIELRDAAGDVIQSAPFDLPVGESVLDLDFSIQPGTGYRLTTNTASNQALLGTDSPRLQRSDTGVTYPYGLPDTLLITGSSLGGNTRYYYFFDWQVTVNALECASERVPVLVTVGTSAAGEQQPVGRVVVQPNPSSGLFVFEMEAVESGTASITISDLAGRAVFVKTFDAVANIAQRQQIDLTAMAAGMYFLKITSGERSGVVKVVLSK